MIHIILGTKAQLIKMAPVMRELEKRDAPYRFIFTGQHYQTIDWLLDNFGIREPDVFLNYKAIDVTGVMQMAKWLWHCWYEAKRREDEIFAPGDGWVLVHGDTISTLFGAALGWRAGKMLAHVESGLRSFDYLNPFPEELVRMMAFRFSHLYFCPTNWAANNLRHYKGEKIITGGNTLMDSLRMVLKENLGPQPDIPQKPYGIVSVHRFENIFQKAHLERIIRILEFVARKYYLLFILHPPTEKKLKKFGFYGRLNDNPFIELRPRHDYFSFIKLCRQSSFMMTDGGSNQEESYYLGLPCLLLRRRTERQEGLGENVLLSKYSQEKIDAFFQSLDSFRRPPLLLTSSPSVCICDFLLRQGETCQRQTSSP